MEGRARDDTFVKTIPFVREEADEQMCVQLEFGVNNEESFFGRTFVNQGVGIGEEVRVHSEEDQNVA